MIRRQIVFDGGPLVQCVLRLLEGSAIEDKIDISYSNSLVAGKPELLVLTDQTEYHWSTGEELLWCFIASLAGQGKIDLHEVAGYFKPTAMAPWMVTCLAELFGVDPADAADEPALVITAISRETPTSEVLENLL